jgi:hypothetical protein
VLFTISVYGGVGGVPSAIVRQSCNHHWLNEQYLQSLQVLHPGYHSQFEKRGHPVLFSKFKMRNTSSGIPLHQECHEVLRQAGDLHHDVQDTLSKNCWHHLPHQLWGCSGISGSLLAGYARSLTVCAQLPGNYWLCNRVWLRSLSGEIPFPIHIWNGISYTRLLSLFLEHIFTIPCMCYHEWVNAGDSNTPLYSVLYTGVY